MPRGVSPTERVLRLGRALVQLEDVEREGAAVCLHSSWCAEPGAGFWIALVRPAGWAGAPLGRPVVGSDLLDVMRRAAALAVPDRTQESEEQRMLDGVDARGDLVPEADFRWEEEDRRRAAEDDAAVLARSLRAERRFGRGDVRRRTRRSGTERP